MSASVGKDSFYHSEQINPRKLSLDVKRNYIRGKIEINLS